jgi:hypothetical protein
MNEPSPGWWPPAAPSPNDWEFCGDVPEHLVISGRGESWAASHPYSVVVGEGGAPSALAEPLAFPGRGGFDFSSADSTTEGLGASPPLGTHLQLGHSLHAGLRGYLEALCIEYCGLTENNQRKCLSQAYLFDRRIEIPFRVPDGGVKAWAVGLGSQILIPPCDFSEAFVAFFWEL